MDIKLPTINPYSQGLDATGHTIEDLFPDFDPKFVPFGHRVLLQLRRVFAKTKSGIVLVQETKDNEAYNIQVARIMRVGPLAFKRRDNGEEWPEGVWGKPGDFVKIMRYEGDRWSFDLPDGGEPVQLVLANDANLLGRYTGNPLDERAYIQ